MDTSVPSPDSDHNDVIKLRILEYEDIVVHSYRGSHKGFLFGPKLAGKFRGDTRSVDDIDEIQRCLAPSKFDGAEAL